MKYTVQITKDSVGADLVLDYDTKEEAIIECLSDPSMLESGDGYRLIGYDDGTGGDLRDGSKALLRTVLDGAINEAQYNTKALAQAAANGLTLSAGYFIIDLEQPVGSAQSILLEARPSPYLSDHGSYVASRVNEHSRSDGNVLGAFYVCNRLNKCHRNAHADMHSSMAVP